MEMRIPSGAGTTLCLYGWIPFRLSLIGVQSSAIVWALVEISGHYNYFTNFICHFIVKKNPGWIFLRIRVYLLISLGKLFVVLASRWTDLRAGLVLRTYLITSCNEVFRHVSDSCSNWHVFFSKSYNLSYFDLCVCVLEVHHVLFWV